MSTQPKSFLTPEEYLEIERKAEQKSEYHNGQMFAMSGASRRHNRLAFRLAGLMERHLSGTRCEGYSSDMRVQAPARNFYTYPDLSIACEEPQFGDSNIDTLLNPTLLVEILSPSTERYDRVAKVPMYRTIPSLRECLLVDQDIYHVELYRRLDTGKWVLLEAAGPEGTIEQASVGYTLHLRELYEGILPESEPA